jgi:hypothetical protein
MGAFDTFAADARPCPSCGDLYWESCQIKFFDPDYDTQGYLRPGEGRALDFDPALIARAELWEHEWVRIGEHARADAIVLLLHDWELRTCSCGAVLMPVAHVSITTMEAGASRFTLDALELWDLRDASRLGSLDFADGDWFRTGDARTGTYPDLDALAALPRHARREAFAAALAVRLAPSAPDDEHDGWTWVSGPVRCESCNRTRVTSASFFVTHPQEGRFFGDAWLGGEITPGTRLGPVPPAPGDERLRGRYYRLREPVPEELTFLDARASYGCACGAGPASTRIRFRRDGHHLVLAELTWRVVRGRADLDEVDWIETRCSGYLARPDVSDEDRVRCILAELQISA